MKLGSVTSQWKNTIRGCPQGSSFGSLLWKSYAFRNDLAYITEEEISIYADDHQIFASGSSTSIVEGKLLSKGGKITRWYKENLLRVNVEKYQSMVLDAESEANNVNLDINGVNIEQLKSVKLFRVFLDSELILVSTLALFAEKLANR